MADLSNRLTTVDDVVAVVNAREARSLLTETNYEILSVEPYSESRQLYNTIVKVKVDLLEGTHLPVPDTERYSIRRVPCYRLTLKEAFKRVGIPFDKVGRYRVGAVTDINAFIASVKDKINFDPEELSYTRIDDETAVVRAVSTSLGFIGNITVTTIDETAPEFITHSVEVAGPSEIDNTHEGMFIITIKDEAGKTGKPKQLSVSVDMMDHVESIAPTTTASTDVLIKFKSVSVNTEVEISVEADGIKGTTRTLLQAF